MPIRAIVPAKPLNRAKSRLSPVLSPEQREALARVMLSHTLQTLKQVQGVSDIFVITRDSAAVALARDHGVKTLQEGSGTPSLVASLTAATQVAKVSRMGGVLIVASDIPFIQVNDLDTMIQMARKSLKPSCVVIAPDRRFDGTNAMLVRPPGAIPYRYGVGSYGHHVEEARKVGADLIVYKSPTLALDIDVPADLQDYLSALENGTHQHAADIRQIDAPSAFDRVNFQI